MSAVDTLESPTDVDGDSKSVAVPHLSPEQRKAVWRKVDLRLMPILSLVYLSAFLDRGNIGNAKLQGLVTQLKLTGNKYNIALTMFFIPYCLLESPTNLVLKKFRPSRWIPGMTVAWGFIMCMMGLVKAYPQLVGVRICLGTAEAGLFPGAAYYLSLWYPRHLLQYRIGLFFGAASVSGAFSGLLAFGIGFMSGTGGLLAWSWIFILEGLATILVGILAFIVMVDLPSTVKFLTPEEKDFVILTKKYDISPLGEEEHFEFRHITMALLDWQTWLHILVYMSLIAPVYAVSFFLPSVIQGFGYTTAVTQLLTVPPYAVGTIILLIFAYYSDKLKMRSPFILAAHILCLVGFAINISSAGNGAKYFGIFLCVSGAYAGFPGVVVWLSNNLSGQYKRGVGMALQIGIGNFAAIVTANVYRTQDAPRYILGHGIEMMMVGIGVVTTLILVVVYARVNKNREAIMQEMGQGGGTKYDKEEWKRLGDKAPNFRYTL